MKQHERTLPLTDPVLFRSRILVHGRRDAVSRRQDWLPRAKVKRSCNFFWFRSSTSNQCDTRYDAVLISFFFSLSQFSSFSFFLLSFIHIFFIAFAFSLFLLDLFFLSSHFIPTLLFSSLGRQDNIISWISSIFSSSLFFCSILFSYLFSCCRSETEPATRETFLWGTIHSRRSSSNCSSSPATRTQLFPRVSHVLRNLLLLLLLLLRSSK